MMNQKPGQGQPLVESERERLRAYVEQVGDDYEAARRLGVGHSSIARGLAGLRLKRSTATAIARSLDALGTRAA